MAFQGPSTPKAQIQKEYRIIISPSPSSTKSKSKASNRFLLLEDQKIIKIRQAKQLLQEALEIEEFQANSYILDEIQNLEYIEEWIQNPQMPTPKEKKQNACQVQKELRIINQKLNHIQEEIKIQKSQIQLQPQSQAQPLQTQLLQAQSLQAQSLQAQPHPQTQRFNKALTFAQNLRESQINSNPDPSPKSTSSGILPIPQVVIPIRRDLMQSPKTQSQAETRARRLLLKVPL